MKRVLRWFLTVFQGGERPDGFTAFGRTIWFTDAPSPGLVAHEALHREQQARDGWRYYVRYGWELVTKGYREVSYEKEAYEAQRRVNETRSGPSSPPPPRRSP